MSTFKSTLAVLMVTLTLYDITLQQSRDEYTNRQFYQQSLHLTEVPDDIPPDAVLVNLQDNSISRLEANAFQHLNACRTLIFERNSIHDIQTGAFSGLTSLIRLQLNRNAIAKLQTDLFAPLFTLAYLDLGFNQISQIELGAFNGLINLETLSLFENHLADIIPGTFNTLSNLNRLTLSFNDFTQYTYDMLKAIPTLETLYLSSTPVELVEEYTFAGLGRLIKLYMKSFRVEHLKVNTFRGLRSLELLDLGYNSLTTIPDGLFSELHKLKILRINNNNLTELTSRMFQGLDSLLELLVYDNKLSTLEPDVFSNLPRPLKLALSYPYSTPEEGNPLQCGGLCWLHEEYDAGSITWYAVVYGAGVYKTKCADYDDWDDILWNCTEGVCSEPGGLSRAVRSGTTWPYRVGDEVTYTCDSCSTGGGTIQCQGYGAWAEKPVCTEISGCATPGTPEHGSRYPLVGPYPCGGVVVYSCGDGYLLEGDRVLSCEPGGEYIGTPPTCVQITDDKTQPPDTQEEESGNDTLVIALSVVGTLVAVVVVVVVVVVILRKRRCTNTPEEKEETKGSTDGGHKNPGLIPAQHLNLNQQNQFHQTHKPSQLHQSNHSEQPNTGQPADPYEPINFHRSSDHRYEPLSRPAPPDRASPDPIPPSPSDLPMYQYIPGFAPSAT